MQCSDNNPGNEFPDLLESLQLLPQSAVLSSQLLQVEAGQSGSVLQALLHPLLHAERVTKTQSGSWGGALIGMLAVTRLEGPPTR